MVGQDCSRLPVFGVKLGHPTVESYKTLHKNKCGSSPAEQTLPWHLSSSSPPSFSSYQHALVGDPLGSVYAGS